MDVVLHGLLGGLFGSLEQGTHIDVETDVGIAGGDHLGAAVVTVLTHLGNHDTRATALFLGKFIATLASPFEGGVVLLFFTVHA